MPERNSWELLQAARVDNQVTRIETAFRDGRGIDIEVVRATDGGVSYMCTGGELLVRDEYVRQVYEIVNPRRHIDFEQVKRIVPGVALIPIIQPRNGERPKVDQFLKVIDRNLGAGIATPNHVLTVAPVGGPCPATEPEEVYEGIEPYPSVCMENGGAGVRIYIADTGLLEDAERNHPWLQGVQRAKQDGTVQDPDPLGPPGPTGRPTIPPYVGHGTFVAGVARCMAPEADVIVSNIFAVAGSAVESDFVTDLAQALDLGVDVFNLSITTATRTDLPLLGFDGFLRRLRQYKGVVCAVAAGNNGDRMPSWPAAYPRMVSVGALGGDWRSRATFSNYGGWVDVYAPGRDLINAYASGTYTCDEEPYKGQDREFYGMAKWSGTSFSTPVVAGLIAARMSRTGENGEEAAAALLAGARARAIPGVGAILLPCGNDGGKPSQRTHGCHCRDDWMPTRC